MNNQSPFEEEQDPQMEVAIGDEGIEVRGVKQLESLEQVKEKLKDLSSEQLIELLRTLNAGEAGAHSTKKSSIHPKTN